jgi:hypothetical protein
MAKKKLVDDLREYFTSKGKFLSYQEYIAAEDAPFRAQIVKRYVGTWARLENIIGEIATKSAPEPAPAPKPEPKVAPVNPQITDAVTTAKGGKK